MKKPKKIFIFFGDGTLAVLINLEFFLKEDISIFFKSKFIINAQVFVFKKITLK